MSYIQKHGDTVSNHPLTTRVEQNFLDGGYGSWKGIDLDDGASFFELHRNILLGNFFKLKGRNVNAHRNLIMFPTSSYAIQLAYIVNNPARIVFSHNTIVTLSKQVYLFEADKSCLKPNYLASYNDYYIRNGAFIVQCYPSNRHSFLDLAGWTKAMGQEVGSKQRNFPSLSQQVRLLDTHYNTYVNPAQVE